jgi:hypothetical protein
MHLGMPTRGRRHVTRIQLLGMTFVSVAKLRCGLPCADMGNQEQLGQQLSRFACALPRLCAELEGDRLVDAVHRLYEDVLCETPRELLDAAHDGMYLLMHRHGLVRRPPADWDRARYRH